MKGGVGKNSGVPSPAPSSSSAPSSSALRSSSRSQRPELPHRCFAPRVALSFHSQYYLPYIRRGEEIQHRLTAPSIREKIPDLPPALPPPGLFPHFRLQDLLLTLPSRAHLKEVVSRLRMALAPPALGGRANLCPMQVVSGSAPRGEGVGKISGYSSPFAPFPSPSAPRVPTPTPHSTCLLRQGPGWPSHICGGAEVQCRLAAPRIAEEVPDCEPALPPSEPVGPSTQGIRTLNTCVCALCGHYQHGACLKCFSLLEFVSVSFWFGACALVFVEDTKSHDCE